MPDISMCLNQDCKMKELCFRFKAKPSEFRQSYISCVPKTNSEVDFECFYFIPLYDFVPNKKG